jgi:hypothetical protein
MATQWYQAVHASKRFRPGTLKKDISGAQFVYAQGVASNVVGAWVTFNGKYIPALLVDTPLTGLVGISCAANILTTTFSWYMVYGETELTALNGLVQITTTSTDKAAMSQSSTAGRATGGGVVATKTIVGALAVGVSAANLGNCLLCFPYCAAGSLA